MKTVKKLFAGLVLFILGVTLTLSVLANHRHHERRNDHNEYRKTTSIEVGAPLTVEQLKHYKFI